MLFFFGSWFLFFFVVFVVVLLLCIDGVWFVGVEIWWGEFVLVEKGCVMV